MSANLDNYLNALGSARKLNKDAEKFADLMIGARRSGMGSSQPGPGGSFPLTRPDYYSYGRRGVGQGSADPRAQECLPPGQTMVPVGTPVAGPCPPEFLCDCDLIGGNTLTTAPVGPNTTRDVTITDFDAVALQAVAIWFTAFVADAGDPDNLLAFPVIEVPTLIFNVRVGNNGQLRAAGVTNGLNSGAFAATREPVCVDWAPFRSQNGQELVISFQNIVATVDVHLFVVLWTNVLQ